LRTAQPEEAIVPVPPSIRPPSRRARSRLLCAGLATALAAGLLGFTSADAAPPGKRAVLAADWIDSQVTRNRIHNNEFDFDDWGLTLDAYLALVATPRHLDTAEGMITATSRHAREYVQVGGAFFAGPSAKMLLARRVAGLDPIVNVGGERVNLRGRLLTMVNPRGRVRDEGDSDFSSTLTQSLAVLAFARSGKAPQAVVDYLLRQRCRQGFFRERLGSRTCSRAGGQPFVDSTAFAVQALVRARSDGAHLPRGALRETGAWLVSVQNDDGSWSAPGTEQDANSNSTGLAAQALAALKATPRRERAIDAAARFVRGLQITPARADGGPAADDVGAIARTSAELEGALETGITASTRDSFRRATAQAQLALRPVPLGRLHIR
jgi:hypothetical protein